jgi:glucose-6-phosphate 1-dehydrogenase
MRFDYNQAFTVSRAIGYEVLIYNCMNSDATLFSRSDLVETAWRIAQPLLDVWKTEPADFPKYPAGSWGPKAAFDLIERDGRKWLEVLNRETLEKVPLFQGADAVLLGSLIMALKPMIFQPGELIIRRGEIGREMYLIAHGEVDVIDASDKVMVTLGEGNFFDEIGLLTSEPRNATIRANSYCDAFMLDKPDFVRVLRDRPQFLKSIVEVAQARYNIAVPPEKMLEYDL